MKRELIILAHNIRSAYNVGSIFRSADGAGVASIVLSGYSARPPHRGVLKTALGAEEFVPWESIGQPGLWLRRMRRAGYQIVALEQSKASTNLFRFRPRWPIILIVGNELRGVSPALQRQASKATSIPMHGQKESLNVASAVAIAVYSLLWQK